MLKMIESRMMMNLLSNMMQMRSWRGSRLRNKNLKQSLNRRNESHDFRRHLLLNRRNIPNPSKV